MPSRVIAISHATGAGGESVGRTVSERLSFRYVDEEIIAHAAAREGIDPALIADVERRRPRQARLLRLIERAAAGQAGLEGLSPGELMSGEELHALIREAIAEVANEGEVVIVSHAASVALAGRPDLLRVLITASSATRARRLAVAEALAVPDAARRIEDADLARAHYLRRYYHIERELPSHYDVVVCTEVLRPGQAAELILHAAGL